jgi:cyanophycinase
MQIWGIASGSDRKLFKHLLATVIAVGVAFTAVLLVEWVVLTTDPGLRHFGADVGKAGPNKGGGSLVICGGGRLPDEVRDRFVELAGGRKAKIVVIPTAHAAADGPDALHYLDIWKHCGVASVELLHTRSRDKANDATFIEPLIDATGVWLGGGKQTWLADVYAGTEVERQLKSLLVRGGVIGGSSAGAAAMTRVMIAGGRAEVKEGQGFDLLPGSIVDQHFMKRNRVSRLLEVLTRHPGLVGFGIDEQTALVVRGKRLTVIGNSYVMACLPSSSGRPPRIEVLKRGDETDLAALSGPSVAITSAMGLDEVLSPLSDN